MDTRGRFRCQKSNKGALPLPICDCVSDVRQLRQDWRLISTMRNSSALATDIWPLNGHIIIIIIIIYSSPTMLVNMNKNSREHELGQKHLSNCKYLARCTLSILLKQALHRGSFDSLGSGNNDSTDDTDDKMRRNPSRIHLWFHLGFPDAAFIRVKALIVRI